MYKSNDKKSFNRFISGISQSVIQIMNLFLLPLSIAFIYIGIKFCFAATTDIVLAKAEFSPIFEHLLISLVIVVCGSALLDISLKQIDS